MADLVVGMAKSVVDGALTKAQAAIEEDAKLRHSAARNLVFITGEFQMMRSFLDVADSERLENPVVKTWVRQISDLAYDVEDCIEFVVHLDKRNRWWLRLLKPFASCLSMPPLPLDVAVDELERLKARVEDVSSRNARYHLINDYGSKPSAPAMQNEQQQPSSSSDAVGGTTGFNRLFEAGIKTTQKGRPWDLTQLLPKENQNLSVISIWATATGVGGGDLGMASSIAWNAYNNRQTCKNFSCRAWVKVMHPFDPHEFIRSLTAQFYANFSHKDEEDMPVGVQILMKIEATRGEGDYHPLKDFGRLVTQNRFLVVLEDVSTMVEWEDIRRFFPDRKNGSCIILSTEQFQVASLSAGHPYEVLPLDQLSDEHPLYAFCSKGSQYDADNHMEAYSNNGVSIPTSKKEAAMKWMEEHPLIGRESEMRDLGGSVIFARSKRYQVMSVWGIAGVGKSALVRNMFCDRIVKAYLFQKYAWVDVSHPFDLWEFSQGLLSNFGSAYLQSSETANFCTMGSKNPIVECREILKHYKCLIVIDGLQTTEEWDVIQTDLVSGSNRQNVIIAVTNDVKIATHCHGVRGELLFNVKGLEADTAFELFQKVSENAKAAMLRESTSIRIESIEFEEAKLREFTSICGGLPRVIVEIASSFAKDQEGWIDALYTNNKFMQEVETNSEFSRLRSLFGWMNSYFLNCFCNFPDSLKPCILYLPIFPRNCIIRRRRLVRRWIAEGYSNDSLEVSAEMIGEKQFSNLVNLSIIQQQPVFGLGNTRMVFCEVNGVFREYIISRQIEENLVFELRGSCAMTTQRTGRHLLISESWDRDRIVFENIDFSRLRSLTVFGDWKSFIISENMKFLRVLDLEGASKVECSDLKKLMKLLCRLKFLSLRGCHEICHLPSSIGNLRQLQTLHVRHTSIVTLPVNISKLEKLQYIRAGTTASAKIARTTHPLVSQNSSNSGGHQLVGVEVPAEIRKLTTLHTFGVVNVIASGEKVVREELKELTQLRKLGVSGINKNNSKKFFLQISVLVHLESLSVQLEKKHQDCLDDIPLPLKSLRSLKVHGLEYRLPKWREQLTMLVKMDLEMAKLTENVSPQSEGVIKFLSGLPKLCMLRLRVKQLQDDRLNVYVMTNDIEEHCFKNMKIFEIVCSSCSHVTFGQKAMKRLEQLKVDCCIGSSISGLTHLPELKEVLLNGSSSSDAALKADLMAELGCQRKPVVKVEVPSSAR